MTNQEILEKAIQKAIDGGFSAKLSGDGWVASYNLHARTDGKAPYDIIYSHDFAKALWGEPYIMSRKEIIDAGFTGGGGGTMTDFTKGDDWQYCLQQMVISNDPIKYLGDNI